MHKNFFIIISAIFLLQLIFSDPFAPLDIDFLKKKVAPKPLAAPKTNKKQKSDYPEYNDVIDGFNKIEGLFDFYWNQEKNQIAISILPEQFNQTYLANITRQSGDAYYYDGSSLMGEYPFIFKKIASTIQLVHINVLFRADPDKAISKAIDKDFSNSIIATSKQLSMPNKETGAILVDASPLFIRDIGYVSQQGRGQYKFDKKNSFFKSILSFPENSELDLIAHYQSSKRTNSYTLPNSRSMEINYHISLSSFPQNNYSPRLLDDRIGYFETMYQDYSNTLQETQYVRYINRWNLKKKDPYAALSEPEEPIVYWIENKVPEEFRHAIRDGILAWNEAFEKIGFKNAIVAKQMPDDADWDPADVRYNTIRWFVQPGSGYAVGPSRANPFTGELYDADVRISADFVRAFYSEFEEFVQPVTSDDIAKMWDNHVEHKHDHNHCKYAEHLREQMSLGWHNMIAQGLISGTKEELLDYVYDGLVDLVLHEVGHTLGLRHNFKGSSIYSIEQLSDRQFTDKYGISGSVMDYHPVNLLDKGHTMFQTKPGPYDLWAIEYGYGEFNTSEEASQLEQIANMSNHPLLAYGTDEDTFGRSSRGVDPLCNVWDMSSDPIGYYDNQLNLVTKLWNNLLNDFEKDGERYQKLRSVFSQGIWEYIGAARTTSKFIGGLHFRRNHIGDPGEQIPFQVVSANEQRRALNFISSRILDKDVFDFDPELLNKLSPERYDDFQWSLWRMDRIDYPIHRVVQRIHLYTLYSLFDPRRLARVQDNEVKFLNDDPFTMKELFFTIDETIWQELALNENINSYKRQLQNMHLEMYSNILLYNYDFNSDAQSLTRNSLKSILKNIYLTLGSSNIDSVTKAHLEFASEKIETILDAEIQLN